MKKNGFTRLIIAAILFFVSCAYGNDSTGRTLSIHSREWESVVLKCVSDTLGDKKLTAEEEVTLLMSVRLFSDINFAYEDLEKSYAALGEKPTVSKNEYLHSFARELAEILDLNEYNSLILCLKFNNLLPKGFHLPLKKMYETHNELQRKAMPTP